jgi:hypothetical protein
MPVEILYLACQMLHVDGIVDSVEEGHGRFLGEVLSRGGKGSGAENLQLARE